MARSLVFFGMALSLATLADAHAQLSPEGGQIVVEANEGLLDTPKKRVTYVGDVAVTQGKTRLAAEQIIIDYTELASSGQTTGTIARILAEGDVRYATPDEQVSADKGVYEARANTLTLEGDVLLINSDGEARGTRMIVSLDRGEWKLFGGRSRRVRTVISPGDARPPAR